MARRRKREKEKEKRPPQLQSLLRRFVFIVTSLGEKAAAAAKAKPKPKPKPKGKRKPSAAGTGARFGDSDHFGRGHIGRSGSRVPKRTGRYGAGSHIFQKGFDPMAKPGQRSSKQLVTVTGEALSTEDRKRSLLSWESGQGNLQVEYFQSEQVKFLAMSVG